MKMALLGGLPFPLLGLLAATALANTPNQSQIFSRTTKSNAGDQRGRGKHDMMSDTLDGADRVDRLCAGRHGLTEETYCDINLSAIDDIGDGTDLRIPRMPAGAFH